MRKVTAALLASCLASTVSGCTSTPSSDPTPTHTTNTKSKAVVEPCTGTVHWSNGSLPPPYNYAWSLTLNTDGTGDFRLSAASAAPEDSESLHFEKLDIDVDPAAATDICATLQGLGYERMNDGSSYWYWDLSVGKGSASDFGRFGLVEAKVRRIVGEEDFNKAHEAFEEWSAEQSGN